MDAPDEHGDIRTLPSAVGVKFVEDEVPEILEDGISNRSLLHACKEKLKHHVVGEQDLRGVLAHRLALLLLFLAGVLAESDGKSAPCVPFVVVPVSVEFVSLRVDQRVHRIDDDRGHSLSSPIGEQVIEYCPDVGQ